MKKIGRGLYWWNNPNINELEMLGEFLIDCGGSDIERVKNMLKKNSSYIANASCADLKNDTIIIGDLRSDQTIDFTMNYTRFLEFLDAWQKVYDTDPAMITITMDPDHDLFTIVGNKGELTVF